MNPPLLTRPRLSGRAVALVLLLTARLPAAAAATDERPNLLFILADDMGWTALSCYGNKDVATPHLDRLAAQGMKFTQAYAEPQCSPTRAALLSGQYGARTGVFRVTHEIQGPYTYLRPPAANTALQPEVANLAQSLRRAGYTTGISGKWHITPDYPAAPVLAREGMKYFDRYGFDFCGTALENDANAKAVVEVTDDIIGFIERNRTRPWFAYAAHFSPHTKLLAPPALVDKHAARGYKRTTAPNGRFSERPTAEYLAMLEHLDTHVGRLLAKLDELDLTRRTVVIFTSDNGGLQSVTSCAPLRAGKGAPYEGGIRVPLLVRWPGQIQPGSVSDVAVHTIDFYPTFMELAGARPPEGHVLDGLSLASVWRGQAMALNRVALFWHIPTYTVGYGRAPCAVVRQGDWKLIHYFGDYIDVSASTPGDRPPGKLVLGARTELYHLLNDIGETTDLAAREPEKTAALRRTLEAWWRQTGAKFPERNPEYDPNNWWARDRIENTPKQRPRPAPAKKTD